MLLDSWTVKSMTADNYKVFANHLADCAFIYLRVVSLWCPSSHGNLHMPCRIHRWWTLDYEWDQCLHFWTDDQSHTLCRVHRPQASVGKKMVYDVNIYTFEKLNIEKTVHFKIIHRHDIKFDITSPPLKWLISGKDDSSKWWITLW